MVTLPEFVMMIGLAGAGKSTMAAKLAKETQAVIIGADAIRAELYGDESIQGDRDLVYQLMEERTLASLKAGKNVVYDAPNVVSWQRRQILLSIPYNIRKEAVWVNTPTQQAIQNNSRRARKVPEWVIYEQAHQFEPPTLAEGWDCVHVVTYN